MSAMTNYKILSVGDRCCELRLAVAHPDAGSTMPAEEPERTALLFSVLAGFCATLGAEGIETALHAYLAYDIADAELLHPERAACFLHAIEVLEEFPPRTNAAGDARSFGAWHLGVRFRSARWCEGLAPELAASNALDLALAAWGNPEEAPRANVELRVIEGAHAVVALNARGESTLGEDPQVLGPAALLSLADHAATFEGHAVPLRDRLPAPRDRDGYRFLDGDLHAALFAGVNELAPDGASRVFEVRLTDRALLQGLPHGQRALLW